MSKFQYKAMTEDGQFVTGEVEAKDRLTAIEKLADQKRTLFELSDPDGTLGFFNFPKIPLSGISPNTVAVSTRQLSEVLGAGMPLVESLGALVNSGTNQKMTEVWQEVIQSILKGQTLSHALAQHPKVFSQLYANLVKVGEATGRLHEMIGEAAGHLEREVEIRRQVRSALTYPVFILITCSVLCYALVSFLLPEFEPVWNQAGMDLSAYPLTEFLIALSRLTHSFWDELLLALIVGGLGFGLHRMLSTADGARRAGKLLFSLPIIGGLAQVTVTARVANTLATLTEAGVSLPVAIKLTAEASGSLVVQDALTNVAGGVEQGKTLAQCLKGANIFPPLLIQMVGIGEQSGRLPDMLARIRVYYQRQLDDTVKTVSSLIEPVTMLVVGGVVGVFIMGVILPILGVVGNIGPS